MEEKKSYYAIIPANVRYDKELPPNAKLLYGEITSLCNDKGFCWASNEYFAGLYKVDKKTVSRWINVLIDKGYIFSTMKYREGSKEIVHRYLQICGGGMDKNVDTPMEDFVDTPMDKNVEDNNTVSNNTVTNNTMNNLIISSNEDIIRQTDVRRCVDLWNDLEQYGIPKIHKLTSTCTRARNLRARLAEYSMEDYEKAIDNIKHSDYLQGKKGDVTWFTFDWFVKPNNFPKVLDGNYNFNKSNRAEVKYAGLKVY